MSAAKAMTPVLVADATNGHSADATNGHTIPVQTRSERFTSFDVADFPAVTGREIGWKYTPVAALAGLIDGSLDGSVYPIEGPVTWVGRDDSRIGTAGIPEDRAAANAWSSFERAAVIEVRGEEPHTVVVRRSGLGSDARAAHTIIDVARFARATVVLENSGDALLAENVEILVGDGADLTVVSVQEWSAGALHVANHFASVGRDAHLKHVLVTLGGAVVRVNPSVTLAGAGADGELLGVYFADAGQHLEHQVFLFHQAEHTKGRVTYKGALQGDGAHTVWVGDVLIGPGATGTDSYEQNRNLVLTEGTRADSVPNLEIETGNILGAGHASATGRFDDEQLFYLQARGIAEDEARRLVVLGFLTDIVQKIDIPALQDELIAAIEAELALTQSAVEASA